MPTQERWQTHRSWRLSPGTKGGLAIPFPLNRFAHWFVLQKVYRVVYCCKWFLMVLAPGEVCRNTPYSVGWQSLKALGPEMAGFEGTQSQQGWTTGFEGTRSSLGGRQGLEVPGSKSIRWTAGFEGTRS